MNRVNDTRLGALPGDEVSRMAVDFQHLVNVKQSMSAEIEAQLPLLPFLSISRQMLFCSQRLQHYTSLCSRPSSSGLSYKGDCTLVGKIQASGADLLISEVCIPYLLL